MSSYNELIKSFEKTRSYMRDFYIYGFKSREEYTEKSARSYDDERRRIESWLGDYMSFVRTAEGKSVFISIDSRSSVHNPFYKALKSKSFTDGDITLHFILFDILNSPDVSLSLPQIMQKADEYLSTFESPMTFDESTVRKKLKEYSQQGIIEIDKQGKKAFYKRAADIDISDCLDILNFYSEIAPCGVIGSFLLDKLSDNTNAFAFKHHYITGALDSDIIADLFCAMGQKRIITVSNAGRAANGPKRLRLIPLRIFISAQNGRQHLIAYHPESKAFKSFRLDYLSSITLEQVTPRFDELREELNEIQSKMWGVTIGTRKERTEHIMFIIRAEGSEEYIIKRLEREKRIGYIEKISENRYKFSADVYDSNELIPWIRTFISRIEKISFSNKTVENQFKRDLNQMYRIYGIEEDEK